MKTIAVAGDKIRVTNLFDGLLKKGNEFVVEWRTLHQVAISAKGVKENVDVILIKMDIMKLFKTRLLLEIN